MVFGIGLINITHFLHYTYVYTRIYFYILHKQNTTIFSLLSDDREDGAELKTTKKRSLGVYLDNLLRKRTQFLKKDNNVEGGAATGSAIAHEDDDNAAPSEATVIIEDEPPRKVRSQTHNDRCVRHF